MTGNELKRILKAHGCKILREGSNHEVWVAPSGVKFTVPRHGQKEIPTGTVKGILKSAGINL